MQPCSQPWYGLIDWLKPISGEVLRAMIVRAGWIVTVVLSGGSASSSLASGASGAQPSSTAARSSRRYRLAGLKVAPRPRSYAMAEVRKTLVPAFAGTTILRCELRVERDRCVQHARYRAVRLCAVGDFGELRGVDIRHARA